MAKCFAKTISPVAIGPALANRQCFNAPANFAVTKLNDKVWQNRDTNMFDTVRPERIKVHERNVKISWKPHMTKKVVEIAIRYHGAYECLREDCRIYSKVCSHCPHLSQCIPTPPAKSTNEMHWQLFAE